MFAQSLTSTRALHRLDGSMCNEANRKAAFTQISLDSACFPQQGVVAGTLPGYVAGSAASKYPLKFGGTSLTPMMSWEYFAI